MASARTSSGFGANPIGHTEILAWATLTRTVPTVWEVAVLRRMDSAYLVACRPPSKDDPTIVVDAHDKAGVTQLMAGFKARAGVKK